MKNLIVPEIGFYSSPPKSIPMIYAIICARYKGSWIFVRHKERSTYEVPGGHIEAEEDAASAAERELYEETGAVDFMIEPVSVYTVTRKGKTSGGYLFYADVKAFSPLPEFEIESVHFFNEIPDKLTYPDIQPVLLKKVREWLKGKDKNHANKYND